MPYRAITANPFGDGSDGAMVISADAYMAQAEYNLVSLTVDATKVWSAPKWSVDFLPIITVRCQTPIVLDGAIRANGVTGFVSGPRTVTDTGAVDAGGGDGMPPAIYGPVDSPEAATAFLPGEILPIPGGADGAAAGVSYLVYPASSGLIFPTPPYTRFDVNSAAGDSIWDSNFARDDMVGPGKPYRYCAGCGGAGFDAAGYGGGGGGILLIYAPAIIFGANADIQSEGAAGGAGEGGAGPGGGGGGGGYVELVTRVAVSTSDWAKVSVDGGALGAGYDGAPDGFAGGTGHRIRRVV